MQTNWGQLYSGVAKHHIAATLAAAIVRNRAIADPDTAVAIFRECWTALDKKPDAAAAD